MTALRRTVRGRRALAICIVALIAVVAAGTTYATTSGLNGIPDQGGVFHACVNNTSGETKLVTATTSCPTGTSAVSWNQAGTRGPQGPAGAAGEQGQQGPAGPSGADTTYNYRFGGIVPGTSVARAFCDPGEKVTGGGGFAVSPNTGLTQNYPISDETGVVAWGTTAIGWQVATEDWGTVQAYVICAS
jgi:hypothetical protein